MLDELGGPDLVEQLHRDAVTLHAIEQRVQHILDVASCDSDFDRSFVRDTA